MTARLPKHLFRLMVICLVLAVPICAIVAVRLHDADAQIATIQTEQSGLHCALVAGDLLTAVERYRLRLEHPERMDAALRILQGPECARFVAGPRVRAGILKSSERTLLGLSNPIERRRGSLALADAVLMVFDDIADASALTYDTTVETVNLEDALIARIPVSTERLDQSAAKLAMAISGQPYQRDDVVGVERLLGEAHAVNSMADDDFTDALLTLPERRALLTTARDAADDAEADLAVALDRNVTAGRPKHGGDGIDDLRTASIDAGLRLLRTSATILESSFESRIAILRQTEQLTVGAGLLLLVGGCAVVDLLWREWRKRDVAELESAQQRALSAETKLAQRNTERALRMTEQQFRAVFEGSSVGIAIVGRDGALDDENPALRAMLDGQLEPLRIVSGELLAQTVRDRRDALRTEHCFAKADGSVWVELSLSIVRDEPDAPVSAILLAHDITEHKTLTARLDHETLHDSLTALPNRVYFMRRLAAVLASAERFAVVFIDLDGFKAVNDTLGHHVGDDILRLAAQRLTTTVRSIDFVARLHGDEFAVLVADAGTYMNAGEIDEIVERIHAALDLTTAGALPIRVSASIGYVRDGCGYADPEDVLRHADDAMYRSKRDGRNRATAYDTSMNAALHAGSEPQS
jgi:diguanylate cyclase (GGDEF)-like protein